MLLKDKHIILASGSPRRIQILREDGLDFEVIRPNCPEHLCTKLSPSQSVMALALRKALDIGERDALILACDTMVFHHGRLIGKPADEAEAFSILSELRGRKHEVWSGVAVLQKNPKLALVFSAVTEVYFKYYTDDEIRGYIATGEPMDKAGAYAIQGGFSRYIDRINGAYDNVVGFPYAEIKERLLNVE